MKGDEPLPEPNFVVYSGMKLNDHELLQYASSRLGKGDKEGCLWMKEVEGGKAKKKQSKSWVVYCARLGGTCPYLCTGYVQRWFLLAGNLLFYFKTETPVSGSLLNRALQVHCLPSGLIGW